MTKYTNAWRQQQQFYPEGERFTVQTPPDPGHGDMSELPNAVVMQDAPTMPDGGEIYSDSIFENYKHLPTSTLVDRTPVEGHGTGNERGRGYGGSTLPTGSDVHYGRGLLGRRRGEDLGADKKGNSEFGRPYRFITDKFFGLLTDGFNPPPITQGVGDRILRRGLNAYPENDGDGGRTRGIGPGSWTVNDPSWRRGWYLNSNVNRDFTPPNRTHTVARMVRPDIVTIVTSAPPPARSDKYASPFNSLAKFMPKRRHIRGARVVPGPWDDQEVANAQPTFEITPIDGMVVL